MSRSPRWVFLPALVAFSALGISTVAFSQGAFTPVEINVTTDEMIDFEFKWDGSPRFTWINHVDGGVWIGDVDPVNGDFVPSHGMVEFVDGDGFISGNGSEWVASADGPRLVYTRKPPGGILRMSQAVFDPVANEWDTNNLAFGALRVLPLGSTDEDDPAPRILNLLPADGGQVQIGWRYLDDPFSERTVPNSLGATGARWVPGELKIIFSAPLGNTRQAFLYDAVTEETTQLTFDNGRKQTVFMWEAPEFPGEKIFFSAVKGQSQSQIRVYRFLDEDGDGEFEWTVIKKINPANPGVYFWSPEPFVHNGKSYIFLSASSDSDPLNFSVPTQILLVGIEPGVTFARNLSEPGLSRLRLDPEVFISDEGPMIYYNRYIVPATPYPDLENNEGVFRVDTGLGPPDL